MKAGGPIFQGGQVALMLFFSPSLSCFTVSPSRKRDLSSAAALKENKAALALALGC